MTASWYEDNAARKFEAERAISRNQWEQIVRTLPGSSPLFAHDRCGSRCERKDPARGLVSRLRASTIKHVGLTLATYANPDGTRAYPGIDRLVLGASRHRATVIAALGHLETVGLIVCTLRAGQMGRPRDWANVYCLATPAIEARAGLVGAAAENAVHDWFTPRRGAEQETPPP